MVIRFTIPVSPNWYAIGEAVVDFDDPSQFDTDSFCGAFYIKKKENSQKLLIRMEKIHTEEDLKFGVNIFDPEYHDGKTICFGKIDGKMVIPVAPPNVDPEVACMMAEVLFSMLEGGREDLEHQSFLSHDIERENVPQELIDNATEFELLVSMIDAGYTKKEQLDAFIAIEDKGDN